MENREEIEKLFEEYDFEPIFHHLFVGGQSSTLQLKVKSKEVENRSTLKELLEPITAIKSDQRINVTVKESDLGEFYIMFGEYLNSKTYFQDTFTEEE